MKTWVRKTLSVGVLAAGALLFGSGAAYAGGGHNGTTQHSGNNNGILNGTQVIAPIDIPVNVAGIGLGILGQGTGVGAASSESGWTEHGKVKQHSGNNNGILNGTQVYAPIDIPVNVAGVGLGILGQGTGSGIATSGGHSTEGASQVSGDNEGILNGTQILAPINAPINVCGIGIGVLGQGTGAAVCSSGDQDGDHDGDDNGDHDGDGDDVDGDHGDDDGDYGDAPRGARAASTEASPVGELTQGATGGALTDSLNGAGLNLGGVPLLNTLR
jgi:hypothetical protein